MKELTLNNGNKIPSIALGTWLIDDKEVTDIVDNAISIGYRHIDTAQAYENETGIGLGIKKNGINRNELFITSKIKAEYKDFDSAYNSILESLNRLQTDYIDLMIIHSPQPWTEFRGSNRYFKENIFVYKALEKAYNEGKVKAIGVSNFLIDDLTNILKNSTIKPMVNQILAHISNTPFELIDFCKENNILVEAYSPIGHGEILKNKIIIDIAKKYNVSPSSLCIKYILDLGLVALPKARSKEHLLDNLNVDFTLSKEDFDILKNIDQIEDYGKDSFFPVFGGKL